jgi:folate-binding protein YgfZ
MSVDEAQHAAVRAAAGLFDMRSRGVIRVTGGDRVRWLDGMVSNDVSALAHDSARSGCYATLLTPKGAIVADLHVLDRGEALWLELARDAVADVVARLGRYIIADDVTLEDASDSLHQLALEGPLAEAILARAAGCALDLAPFSCKELTLAGVGVVVGAFGWSGERAFRIFVPAASCDDVVAALMEAGDRDGLLRGDAALLEVLRIEAGTPLLGAELDEQVLPDEARLDHAISSDKGCYVGQEIIARLRSRGKVNHLLVGLHFDSGELPAVDADLVAGEKRSGEVTSVCSSPTLGAIGLGYLRREHAEPGTRVRAGELDAEVVELPFVRGSAFAAVD